MANPFKWLRKKEPEHNQECTEEAQKKLLEAQEGLQEDLLQTGSIRIQRQRADRLIDRLDGIVKENNIGPSVERSLYGRRSA